MLKNNIRLHTHRLLLIVLFLFCAGCSSTKSPETFDVSFLKAQDCDQGCLLGIEPGKTSLEEANKILTKNNLNIEPNSIKIGSYFDYGLSNEIENINFSFTNPNLRCSISYADNVVNRIDIGGLGGRSEITNIENLVELIGEPDLYLIDIINPGVTMCSVDFFWKDLQIVAISYDTRIRLFGANLCLKIENNKGVVNKDLKIDEIVILSQELFMKYNQVDAPKWVGFKGEK